MGGEKSGRGLNNEATNLRIKLDRDSTDGWGWLVSYYGADDLRAGNIITVTVNPGGYYETSFVDAVTGVPLADSVTVYY